MKMMIENVHQFGVYAAAVAGIAICLAAATHWLLGDDLDYNKDKRLYKVKGEFVVVKTLSEVYARNESEAIEHVRPYAEQVASDMGIEGPEIVWAEEFNDD